MNAAVAGSNPVDANLIRGKDASGATIHSAGGSKVKGHRRLSSIMDLAPNLGSDYFDGGAIDSLTHNSGHGTGVWRPGPWTGPCVCGARTRTPRAGTAPRWGTRTTVRLFQFSYDWQLWEI